MQYLLTTIASILTEQIPDGGSDSLPCVTSCVHGGTSRQPVRCVALHGQVRCFRDLSFSNDSCGCVIRSRSCWCL